MRITEHGRPVATLVPFEAERVAPLEQLVSSGRATAPSADLLVAGAPVVGRPGVASPTGVLAAQRADER